MTKFMDRPGGNARRRGLAIATGMVALLLGMAACGSSGGSGSSAGGSDKGGDDSAVSAITDAQAQKQVDTAFSTTDIKLDSLDPTVQEALKRSAITLTGAQKESALKCWKATTCDVGDGSITLGIADGFGGNQWRKVVKMEVILQALTYPEIGKIIYTDANGDLPTYLSNVRSLSSQGAKAIVGFNDFGSAALPAFKAAQAAGAKVSTYVSPTPNAPTASLSNEVTADVCGMGKAMADVATKNLGLTGDLAILNGTPGNPQGAAWNKCLKEALPSGTEIGQSVDTSWTLAGAFDGASALVSSGKEYRAIFYDYADPVPQVVEAYTKAGKKIPAIITWTSNNGAARAWEEKLGTPDEFTLYHTSALTWESRASVTAAVAQLSGEKVKPVIEVPRPFVKAVKGYWIKNRSDEYPGPSTLVPDDVMNKMLAKG